MGTKEKIKVMQAYLDGYAIEIATKENAANGKWCDYDAGEPSWNWVDLNYRIKPEPKVRPYSFTDMKEAVKKHGGFVCDDNNRCWCFSYFDICGVWFEDTNTTYEDFAKYYSWLDDASPCGIKEE